MERKSENYLTLPALRSVEEGEKDPPLDGTPSFLLPLFVPLTPVLPITIGIPRDDNRDLYLGWRHSSEDFTPPFWYSFVPDYRRDSSSVYESYTTTCDALNDPPPPPPAPAITFASSTQTRAIDGDDSGCNIGTDICLFCLGYDAVYLIPGNNNTRW